LPRKSKGKVDKKVEEKKKQIKLYFNADTQAAIEKFQKTESIEEKNEIYTQEIRPAFEKLSENLIFIYKFTSLHETFEDLKSDCVTFLYETLYKFDASRGTKAFSYFNVVAKNFLIIKSKQKVKSLKRKVSIEDKNIFTSQESHSFDMRNITTDPEKVMVAQAQSKLLMDMLLHLSGVARTDNEIACMSAIKTLFDNIDNLEFLNKRAVFVYLREMSGLTPKQLTTTISNLKKKYRGLKEKDEFRIFFE